MKYQSVDVIGKFNPPVVGTLPTWNGDEEGKMYYLNGGTLWYGTDREFVKIDITDNSFRVNQSHLFDVMNAVRWNGSEWVGAVAVGDDTAATHIVVHVEDSNNFTLADTGVWSTSTNSGYSSGVMYLHNTSSGEITDTTPTPAFASQTVITIIDGFNYIITMGRLITPIQHNITNNIQGGNGVDEYYHVDVSQHTQLLEVIDGTVTDNTIHSHSGLTSPDGTVNDLIKTDNLENVIISQSSAGVSNLGFESLNGDMVWIRNDSNGDFSINYSDLNDHIMNVGGNGDVRFTINYTQGINNISNDSTLSSNTSGSFPVPSDTTLVTEKAISEYIETTVINLHWQNEVLSMTTDITGTSPTSGSNERYIVPSGATGDWLGEDDSIAEWNGTSWDINSPTNGTTLSVDDEGTNFTYNGTTWVPFGSTVTHNYMIGLQGGNGTDEFYHLTSAQHTIVGNTQGTNTGDQTSSDFTHDSLQGVSTLEHLDWTQDQGVNNIDENNYDISGYTHSQPTSATDWIITHNLGQQLNHVTCSDANYNLIDPLSVVFDSTTQTTVSFSIARSGYALIGK